MKRRNDKLESALSERTTLRALLVATLVIFLGIVLLIVAALVQPGGAQTLWSNVLATLGNLLIASVALALLWELFGKRAFVDELLSKVRISHEVAAAGIIGVTHDYNDFTDWDSLFSTTEKLDIFVAYARGWRNANRARLGALAKRSGARIRVVLADPDDERVVDHLADRFDTTPEQVRELIHEAENDYRNLRPTTGPRCASISLWYLRASPLFSFYRFDRIVMLSLYSHSRKRGAVPTFMMEQGGTLYNFVRQEFDAMIDSEKGTARLVWEQNA